MAVVLIVDDDADSCEFLARFLQRRGHKAVCAQSGREALSLLATVRPQVVVLDVRMPEMDGVSFLHLLRSYYHGSKVPVILLTGLKDGPHVERVSELGVRQIFVKAEYKLADLLASVERAEQNET